MRNFSTHWVLKAPLCDSHDTHIGDYILSSVVLTTRDQKLWTRNTERFQFLGVGGNWSARRKPTK